MFLVVPVGNESCFFPQEIMVGSMYQAETPVGLCKYKDNEKGELFRLSQCLVAQVLNYKETLYQTLSLTIIK